MCYKQFFHANIQDGLELCTQYLHVFGATIMYQLWDTVCCVMNTKRCCEHNAHGSSQFLYLSPYSSCVVFNGHVKLGWICSTIPPPVSGISFSTCKFQPPSPLSVCVCVVDPHYHFTHSSRQHSLTIWHYTLPT